MAGSLFDKMDALIKGVRHFALGIALAIVSLFAAYFILMTAWRLAGLLWRVMFGHPWGV
jgi:hypothetical protein